MAKKYIELVRIIQAVINLNDKLNGEYVFVKNSVYNFFRA